MLDELSAARSVPLPVPIPNDASQLGLQPFFQ